MKFAIVLLAAGMCFGCAGPNSRKVTVVTENGAPIRGAVTFPQPINSAPKESDEDGRILVYGSRPEDKFMLIAQGFMDGVFRYGDKRTIFPLKAVPKSQEADADEAARKMLLE